MAWALDSRFTSYAALFGTSWGFCILGMICAVPVVLYRVQESEVSPEDFVATAKGVEEIAHAGPGVTETTEKV